MAYHWLDVDSYFNCPSQYNEYPEMFQAFSFAGLDGAANVYYPLYNITKEFATFHPGGASVYNSTSDYTPIKTVYSKLFNVRMVTIVNTDVDPVNTTLDFGENVTTIYSDKGEIFVRSSDNLFHLEQIDSYEVASFYGSVAYPYRVEELCEDTLSGLGEFANLLPIIITVAIAGLLIMFLLNQSEATGSIEAMGIAVVSMIVAVVIGGQIISKATGC